MRDHILAEIKRLAVASGGRAPGVRSFETQTGITEGTWRGNYWARWSDALAEAGYEPNQWQEKFDAEFVIQRYIEAARHYRRLPTAIELRLYRKSHADFPNEKTISKYFGSMAELRANVRSWINGKEDFRDVLAMLPSETFAEQVRASKEGLVYLIKSGHHYKIGRSDQLERRVREIRVALPESATLIHSIRTDDPAGIEAYWHRRFAARRANGEWFKLTTADIAAFRRRKYQ